MARLRWQIVTDRGVVLDTERVDSCADCPNSNMNIKICRMALKPLNDNLKFPFWCPLKNTAGR